MRQVTEKLQSRRCFAEVSKCLMVLIFNFTCAGSFSRNLGLRLATLRLKVTVV